MHFCLVRILFLSVIQEMAAVQGELRESRVQLELHAQQAALQKGKLSRVYCCAQCRVVMFNFCSIIYVQLRLYARECDSLRNDFTSSRLYFISTEHLERAVLAERAKVASQVHKLDELRQLLHDKTLTVDSLRRQLEGSSGNGGSSSNNFHINHNADSHRLNLHKNIISQTQQRAHMSVTDQRAVDFLRRNGNYAGEGMRFLFRLSCCSLFRNCVTWSFR